MTLIIIDGRIQENIKEIIYQCPDFESLNDWHYISYAFPGYLGHIVDRVEMGKFYDTIL